MMNRLQMYPKKRLDLVGRPTAIASHTAAHPQQNHLLATLPAAEYTRLQPYLEPVELSLGQVLYESGGQLTHAYFPITAIVSLLYVMENGASAEIAVTGNDGIVGVALFMGRAIARLYKSMPYSA